MVKELAEHYEAGKQLSRYPYEMLDENKWLAARHGLEGDLVDLPDTERVPAPRAGAKGHGPAAPARGGARLDRRIDRLEDLLENGNGAARQPVVYEANHDLREVVREIVDADGARGRPSRAGEPGCSCRRVL